MENGDEVTYFDTTPTMRQRRPTKNEPSLLHLYREAAAKHLISNTNYNLNSKIVTSFTQQFGMKNYSSITSFMVMQKTQKMSHAAHAKTVCIKKMHTAEKCGRKMKMLN